MHQAKIVCEGIQLIPPNPGSTECDVVYELKHESTRPALQLSRGPWHIAVRYSQVAALEATLQEVKAHRHPWNLQQLSRFSPYRFGASASQDVIAERTHGLCRYLEHVLQVTEPPAPHWIFVPFDEFVHKHWLCQESPASSKCPQFLSPPSANLLSTAFTATHLTGNQDPESSHTVCSMSEGGSKLLDINTKFIQDATCGVVVDTGQVCRCSRKDVTGCFEIDADGAADNERVAPWHRTWPKRIAPFIDPFPPSEARNAVCTICHQHLRRGPSKWRRSNPNAQLKGCLRLRSCSHEFHSACFESLCQHPRGHKRETCPECGAPWTQWGPEPAAKKVVAFSSPNAKKCSVMMWSHLRPQLPHTAAPVKLWQRSKYDTVYP